MTRPSDVLLERERMGFVGPGNAVVVEEPRDLKFCLVDETRWIDPAICLETEGFFGHEKHGSNRYGHPRLTM